MKFINENIYSHGRGKISNLLNRFLHAHMAVAKEPISQPSLEISPIWTTLINEEVSKLQ
jgi:hypothetical protein